VLWQHQQRAAFGICAREISFNNILLIIMDKLSSKRNQQFSSPLPLSTSSSNLPPEFDSQLGSAANYLVNHYARKVLDATISHNSNAFFLIQPQPNETSDNNNAGLVIRFLDLKKFKFAANSQDYLATQFKLIQPSGTAAIPSNVNKIQISANENYILLSSSHQIFILKLISNRLESALIHKAETQIIQSKLYEIGNYYFNNPASSTLYNTSLSLNNERFNQIRQVSFHSASLNHIVVLSSDNRLRFFNLKVNIEVCEQEFNLNLATELSSSGRNHNFVSFAFGLSNINDSSAVWEQFTLYFLSKQGGISVICPIFPYQTSLSYATVRELLETEVSQLETYTENNQTGQYNREINEISARISYLRTTFFDSDSGEDENSAKHTEFVISKRCDYTAAVQPVIEIGMWSPNTGNSGNLGALGGDCVQFQLIPHMNYPLRFLRIFSSGRIDVILGCYPVDPCFSQRNSNLSDCFIPADSVNLNLLGSNAVESACVDRFDSDSALIFTNYAVFQLKFPWIDQISGILAQQSANSEQESDEFYSNQLVAAIQSAQTDQKLLFSSNKRLSSAVYCSEPILGKLLLLFDSNSNVSAVKIPKFKHKTIEKRLLQQLNSPAGEEISQIKATGAQDLGVKPFSEIISGFLANYGANYSVPSLIPRGTGINIRNSAHFQLFLQQYSAYTAARLDCNELAFAVQERIKFLASLTSKEEQFFLGLEKKIIETKAMQAKINQELRSYQEIQRELAQRTREIMGKFLAIQPLSTEEKKFQRTLQNVKQRQLPLYLEQLRNIQLKAETIGTMLGGGKSGRIAGHAEKSIGVNPAQIELLHEPLQQQTEAIGELLQEVRSVGNELQQVRVKASPAY
jgi:hypothetical protein